MPRLPHLDGFRALAILLVIAAHVLHFNFKLPVENLGTLGVLFFFILSGYLITGLLLAEPKPTLSTFYLRRALRLFPAFFLFLLSVCALQLTGLIDDTSKRTVLDCLLYIRNLDGSGVTTGHIWSLSLEEQFYLLWPVIILAVSPKSALRVALLTILAITAFRTLAISLEWWDYNSGAFYVRSWFRFDSILIGCALRLWLINAPKPVIPALFGANLAPLVLWPAALAWTLCCEPIFPELFITVQMALAALLFLHLLTTCNSTYLAVFTNPAVRWIGRISYSWYLWQQLFLVSSAPGWHGLRSFPLSLIASLAAAALSYYLIERPVLALRDRLAQAKPALQAA